MRIGIPLWQNRVAPLLDCCSKLKVFELDNKRVKVADVIDMQEMNISERLKTFRRLELDVVICNGISFFYRACLWINAIKVMPNIIGEETFIIARYLRSDHDLMRKNKIKRRAKNGNFTT